MILQDLHTHTVYCDGQNTPEDMVRAAIEKGMSRIGFSGHCYTFFDTSYCMSEDGVKEYCAEIAALKEKYRGQIEILCGVEQDYYATASTAPFDYVIGSVHYVRAGEEYLPVDESEQTLLRGVKKHFGGDFYAFAERYFAVVGDVLAKTNADIIGHFDLISKFNEGGRLFDERHPRYVAAYQAAIDKLLPYGKPFEVNTGAISRGYRTHPYPSRAMLEYIAEKGGSVILSGDSHSKDALCCAFEKWYAACQKIGVNVVWDV
ncbi:MAG: histidinol-phosphatase [Clostridia bacterium]|nr:histidinol-phosphatase [Clostridia bacterium]